MMAQKHTFFQYWRLKLIVVLLRAYIRSISGRILERDRQLAPPEVKTERIKIPSRDQGRYILADVYYPPDDTPSPSSPSSSSHQTPRPVLLNYHGSGFVFPLLGSDALFCSRMARDTGAVVIDADYRKAPENPFPAALYDVEDALRWVAGRSDSFDRDRIGLCGFSAGGTLALAGATAVREALGNLLNIRVVIGIYAGTDLAADPATRRVPHPINPHSPQALRLFTDCYAPDVQSRSDPAISPGFAAADKFPPTVALLACSGDTLMPEADALAKKIENSGISVHVINHVLEDVPHAFDKGAKEGTVAWVRREEAYGLTAEVLRESFGM